MNQNWFTAVRLNNNNAIQRLVNQGVDINAKDEDGETALYRAVKVGEKAVEKLLEHGADPNIRSDFSQETPLTEAVSENNPRIVELLLNKNADTNALNGNEYTPLIIAAENIGNRDKQSDALRIIELLCQAGADTNQQDGAGNHIYPLERLIYSYNRTRSAAIKRGIVDAIRLLARYDVNLNIELRDEDEDDENDNIPILYSPLLSAIKDGKRELALLLIELGADVNYENAVGETPLFLAARSGYVNLVEELLNRGARITDEIREIIEQNSNNISSEEVRNLLSERIYGEDELVEPVLPRNIANNVNVGTCYDLIEIEDIDAKNYLRQDRNNILLVEFNTVVCQNRTTLPTRLVYECREATGYTPPGNIIRSVKYIKIGINNNLISEVDYRKLLDRQYDIYVLKEVEPKRILAGVVAVETIDRQGTWISADHCQPGSGGKLYKLDAYSLKDGLQYLKRNGGKKHAKKLLHTRKQQRGHLKKRSATRGRGRKYRTYSKKKGGKGKRNKTNKRK